jgi:PTH1 family peptidyl-tRNA hydrolase
MKLIVGLGNPGRAYEKTRHNIGFEVVDRLAEKAGAAFRKRLLAPVQTAEATIGSGTVLLVKPLTFMNTSGPAVAGIARKKGTAAEDLVVVVDDVDLPLGKLRIRPKGSAGGHNGLKSVIAHFGSEDFARVRVGVGRPGEGDMVKHVLSKFAPDERDVIRDAIERAAEAVECLVRDGVDKAMNEFNG